MIHPVGGHEPPFQGEHNSEILAELGLDEDEIRALAESIVLIRRVPR